METPTQSRKDPWVSFLTIRQKELDWRRDASSSHEHELKHRETQWCGYNTMCCATSICSTEVHDFPSMVREWPIHLVIYLHSSQHQPHSKSFHCSHVGFNLLAELHVYSTDKGRKWHIIGKHCILSGWEGEKFFIKKILWVNGHTAKEKLASIQVVFSFGDLMTRLRETKPITNSNRNKATTCILFLANMEDFYFLWWK